VSLSKRGVYCACIHSFVGPALIQGQHQGTCFKPDKDSSEPIAGMDWWCNMRPGISIVVQTYMLRPGHVRCISDYNTTSCAATCPHEKTNKSGRQPGYQSVSITLTPCKKKANSLCCTGIAISSSNRNNPGHFHFPAWATDDTGRAKLGGKKGAVF
jgi:hypothetical protein